LGLITQLIHLPDLYNKNWAWQNYVAQRSLMQADNVRNQLQRVMERSEIELVSLDDQKKLYESIRKALVCGFFMQVAHKEGEKGAYLTVKDNQVSSDWVDHEMEVKLSIVNRSLRYTRHVAWIVSQNG
jgi:GTP1/Obg family GTP-binding protein